MESKLELEWSIEEVDITQTVQETVEDESLDAYACAGTYCGVVSIGG